MRRLLAALLVVAGCGVRAPAPLDVAALVARHGATEARRELTIRVLEDPRDVQARLALAALADQTGRPSEAIEQLEAVERLGGPFGIRWHDDDRARLGRLLLARARVRLARGAASALDDFERARSYGARPSSDELEQARAAVAIVQLRHASADERAKGRSILAAFSDRDPGRIVRHAAPAVQGAPRPDGEVRLGSEPRTGDPRSTGEPGRAGEPRTGEPRGPGEPRGAAKRTRGAITAADAATWRGARTDATPAERGVFGAWAWSVGARREAYDNLAAWHAATRPPRDPQLQAAYLRALAWWSPVWLGEAPLPPAEDLVGPERCWFPGGDCTPADREDLSREAAHPDPDVVTRVNATADRAAATQGAATQGAATHDAVPHEKAPRQRDAVSRASVPHEMAPTQRDAGRLGAVSTDPEIEEHASSDDEVPSGVSARALAAARYAKARSPGGARLATLAQIASAYARDPSRAERLGRELVAGSADAAVGHATIAALFDALGDPGRARAAWQAAVAASSEASFVRGLAEAAARGGDGPAALVYGTQAAAAWGDPAVVWTGVARALLAGEQSVDALTAASNALDLAGPEALADALEVAIAASRALGRTAQVDMLQAKRARFESFVRGGTDATPATAHDDAASGDAEVHAALAAHRARPTAATTARLWVVSRAHPRDVELRAALIGALDGEDPRHATIVHELVELAGDPDPQRALAAITALPW